MFHDTSKLTLSQVPKSEVSERSEANPVGVCVTTPAASHVLHHIFDSNFITHLSY